MGPIPSRVTVMARLLALLVIAGCTTGPNPADVPDGYAVVSGDRYAFAYPADWEREPDLATVEGPVVEAVGKALEADRHVTAALALDPTARGEFDGLVRGLMLNADLRTGGREILAEDDSIDTPGASDTYLADLTWTILHPDTNEEVDVRQYDFLALRDDGVLAYLFVSAPAEHLDEDVARTIVESLDLR